MYQSKALANARKHAFKNMEVAQQVLLGEKQEEEKGEEREEFLCALTKKLMVQPALLVVDQKVYERGAIVAWVEKHKKAPNGAPAELKDVVALPFLQKQIEEFN